MADFWTSKADMLAARYGLAASTIGPDKGYIYGGYYQSVDCKEYSQSDNSWASKTDMLGIMIAISKIAMNIVNQVIAG